MKTIEELIIEMGSAMDSALPHDGRPQTEQNVLAVDTLLENEGVDSDVVLMLVDASFPIFEQRMLATFKRAEQTDEDIMETRTRVKSAFGSAVMTAFLLGYKYAREGGPS